MYNINFLPQMKKFREQLFGAGVNPRDVELNHSYCPPAELEMLECVEDTNGEWVPRESFENSANH